MSPVNYGFLNVEDCQKYDFDSATSRDMRLCKTKVTLAYYFLLTLPVPCIFESCIEIRITLNFYFHTSLCCLKGFYEGLSQRTVKRKI